MLSVAFGVIGMPTGFVYTIVFEDDNFIWLTTDLEGASYKKPGLPPHTLEINSIRALMTDLQDDPRKFSS